jgi:hypothetical protein
MKDKKASGAKGVPPKKRRKRSPKPCPGCGSHNVVPIMYGYPMPEAEAEANEGKIFLGGCCVGPSDPQRHCKACGEQFDFPPIERSR